MEKSFHIWFREPGITFLVEPIRKGLVMVSSMVSINRATKQVYNSLSWVWGKYTSISVNL